MANLFDLITVSNPFLVGKDWKAEPPPSLAGITDIYLDFETNGLKWWEKDRPIGCGVCWEENGQPRTQYLAWGHQGFGGQHDEVVIKRWFQEVIRHKRITNLNTRFDIHMAHSWGVDFEEQGCEVSDVGHYAALLNDHRLHFSLESLCLDYLEDERKVKVVGEIELDPTLMAQYAPGIVAVRAEADVRQVYKLKQKLWPELTKQDLHTVREVEDQVIYVVCEMERNGTLIDEELLEKWRLDCAREIEKEQFKIQKATGKKINPGSWKDLEDLFEKLGIVTARTVKGRASFTDEILKKIDHPVVKSVRRANRLRSLKAKFLDKYVGCRDSKGILRYALHQLRAQKDEDSSYETGTVTGRFSSTSFSDKVGCNIQQVIKVAKQRVSFGFEEDDPTHDNEIFIIRRLHVPEKGMHWFTSDGEQIQYRLFAHEANSPKIVAAYKNNPNTHFHKLVWAEVKKHKPDLTYRRQKDLNFATIFGAGLKKQALMLEFITAEQFRKLNEEKATRYHPLLASTLEVRQIYDRVLPEVPELLSRASLIAENRGYVKSLLGRRMRFPDKQRLHKALNGRIQMSEADILKVKLVELHKARKWTGLKLRIPVHDEIDGDVADQESAKRVMTILNFQTFPLRIPILWGGGLGANWAECKTGVESMFGKAHETREIAMQVGNELDSKLAVRDRPYSLG